MVLVGCRISMLQDERLWHSCGGGGWELEMPLKTEWWPTVQTHNWAEDKCSFCSKTKKLSVCKYPRGAAAMPAFTELKKKNTESIWKQECAHIRTVNCCCIGHRGWEELYSSKYMWNDTQLDYSKKKKRHSMDYMGRYIFLINTLLYENRK